MHRIIGCLLFSALLGDAGRPDRGRITGRVLSRDGNPVANVKVAARVTGPGMRVLSDPWAMTDDDGRFAIYQLLLGTYQMYTEKKSDDYPNTMARFYRESPLPTVSLTPDNLSAEINIQLGPEAGEITGIISDSTTGTPINADVSLWRRDNKNEIVTSPSPKYLLLIPTDIDVDMEVGTDGYAGWTYAGSHNGAALRVKSGEKIILNIKLDPLRRIRIPRRFR